MLIILAFLTTILLGMLKGSYPADFPAYGIVLPLVMLGLFEGAKEILREVMTMVHRSENSPSPKGGLSKSDRGLVVRYSNVIDINPILQKRKQERGGDDDFIA